MVVSHPLRPPFQTPDSFVLELKNSSIPLSYPKHILPKVYPSCYIYCKTLVLHCTISYCVTIICMFMSAAKSLQLCPTLCNPIGGNPQGSPHPWDSPGKNTGVGCHFLLQCMKVKSEGEVAQSCPTLSDPMDCSLPGYSIHGIFQARVLEWGAMVYV